MARTACWSARTARPAITSTCATCSPSPSRWPSRVRPSERRAGAAAMAARGTCAGCLGLSGPRRWPTRAWPGQGCHKNDSAWQLAPDRKPVRAKRLVCLSGAAAGRPLHLTRSLQSAALVPRRGCAELAGRPARAVASSGSWPLIWFFGYVGEGRASCSCSGHSPGFFLSSHICVWLYSVVCPQIMAARRGVAVVSPYDARAVVCWGGAASTLKYVFEV